MAVEKVDSSSSIAEVIDRILDKGIFIDAWLRKHLRMQGRTKTGINTDEV